MMIKIILFFIFCISLLQFFASSSQQNEICVNGSNSHIKIAFMGDSLVSQAYFDLNLVDQMMNELKNLNSNIIYNISFQCFASGGSAIANIKQNQLLSVVKYQPNGTILFWDTDVSGVDETTMTQDEVSSLRSTFQANVREVTQTILNETNSLMVLSGPGVLGDDQVIKSADFWHKSSMLNDYVDMVESVSNENNVSYINMRREYLQKIPNFKNSFPGFSYTRLFVKAHYFVSREGEHPNFTAVTINVRQFATKIYNWFYSDCL